MPSLEMSLGLKLGQRSTGFEIAQNRETVLSMPFSDHMIPIKFTQTIQNTLKLHVALNDNLLQ